jgi:hypothetical protein
VAVVFVVKVAKVVVVAVVVNVQKKIQLKHGYLSPNWVD